MIRQLAHVCLGTPDLDRAVEFYQRVLEFETVHEFVNDQGERYGVFLHCGGRTFLELFNDQETPKDGGFFRHVCFEVEDIEEILTRLNQRGIKAEARRGRSDGVLLAVIQDTDGNEVEFHQYDDDCVTKKFLETHI